MDRIKRLREFLEGSPNDPFLQHALALEYVKLNDDKEARIIFEQILAKDPSYVGSYYHLGRLLERLGETDQAIAVFENGMLVAKELKDQHAFNELRAACDDLV